MFYILHGADFLKRNQKVLQLVETLLVKKPETLWLKSMLAKLIRVV